MEEIKPSNLELFRSYLLDLQKLPDDESKNHTIYGWQDKLSIIQNIAKQLVHFLYKSNPAQSQEVNSRINHFMRDDYFVYKDYIPYFLSGINTYQTEYAAYLIRTGLLEKPIQEMTGFEFKTLLLATLKEHQDRQP